MGAKRDEKMVSYDCTGAVVSIILDELTPCLRHRGSNELYDTDIQIAESSDLTQLDHWIFAWDVYIGHPEYEVYKLMVKGQTRIEGLVCLEPDDQFVFVHLVESAPWNIGRTQEFAGVGGHLFAVACQRSFDLGCDGFVCFEAKSALVEHYRTSLHAQQIGNRRMVIDNKAARALVTLYMKTDEMG